jgi:tRNA-specific 2-thiouridylase
MFVVFIKYAIYNVFNKIDTGLYAQTRQKNDGSFDLLEGKDRNKDQTYFLALLNQNQISHALFPIGHLQKSEVRDCAKNFDLPTHSKKDSQGICFIGEVKMSDFLNTFVPHKPGNIINLEGKILGQHKGLHLYTLGQKKGIGVASNQYKEAYVVVAKKSESNELVVAFDHPDTPFLYAKECFVSHLSTTHLPFQKQMDILARPRYRAQASEIHLELLEQNRAHLCFQEPQRALTPGQICAFYHENVLLGGGVFEQIEYA